MKKLTVKLAVILGILLLVSNEIGCAAPAPEPLTLTPEEERLHESSKEERLHESAKAHLDRWDRAIARFEEEDSINPPPKDAILFVGDSSIKLWNTEKWFPDLPTINRGFGGRITDLLYYADRIIIPYEPSTIVLNIGGYEIIVAGKSPEMVLADLKALLIKIRQALPQTRIIVLSIRPESQRWEYWPTYQEANDLISNLCETQQNIYFADVAEVMFDETGELRKDVFLVDGSRLNETGYELWTPVVRALIDL